MAATDKYFSTKSPPGPWDYIVIGSGMGGMTSAAMLAKLGKRVLVLEQHYVPGGFTHTFKRHKWRWDVGVHAVGEVTDRGMVGRFWHALTDGELEWASLGPVYDEFNFPDGYRIDFPSSREEFRECLVEAFPAEQEAIDNYIMTVRAKVKATRGYFLSQALPPWLGGIAKPMIAGEASRAFAQTTSDAIAEFTSNKRLRAILTAQWAYYGTPPSASSFMVHAITARHFFFGAYYPRGGSQRIAECMLKPVVRAGGAVRIRASVAEILVERGRAVGVRLDSGEEIRAGRVISAVSALITTQRLLPERLRTASWVRDIGAIKQSPGHVCVYLGFKGDIRAAGASSANQWYYDTWDHDTAHWDFRSGADAPVLYVSYNSLKNPDYDPGPEQLHTGEIITFPGGSFDEWADKRWKKRGPEYEQLKEELSQRLIDQLCRRLPKLRPLIAYHEMSTPLSTLHFDRSPGGAIYGLESTPARFAVASLRPRTPVKNLYIAGCDAGLAGVVGAMVGGALAVLAAEPRRALRFLGKMQQRR